MVFTEEAIVPDASVAWSRAIQPLRYGGRRVIIYYKKLLAALAEAYGVDPELPYCDLPDSFREILLEGSVINRLNIICAAGSSRSRSRGYIRCYNGAWRRMKRGNESLVT